MHALYGIVIYMAWITVCWMCN